MCVCVCVGVVSEEGTVVLAGERGWLVWSRRSRASKRRERVNQRNREAEAKRR